MAIRVEKCESIDHGCQIAILPDKEDAVAYLEKRCNEHNWQVGVSGVVPNTHLISLQIQGPTAEEFRSELQSNPEFDFSACRS
jgi:hypothetical protein